MIDYGKLLEEISGVFKTDQRIAEKINIIVGSPGYVERQKIQRIRSGKTKIPDHPTGQAILILHAMYVVKRVNEH